MGTPTKLGKYALDTHALGPWGHGRGLQGLRSGSAAGGRDQGDPPGARGRAGRGADAAAFRAKAALAVMHQVLSVEPVSPSKLNLDVSAALDALVAKAMAKRREERFQSAGEFARALKEATKRRPIPVEDMPSMVTITDTAFEALDLALPRTPPKTPSKTAPNTPPNKESVPRRKWLVMAGIPAVVAVGVVAFLMTYSSLRVDPGPSAGRRALLDVFQDCLRGLGPILAHPSRPRERVVRLCP